MKIRSLVGAGLGLVVAFAAVLPPAGATGGFDATTSSVGFAQAAEAPSAGEPEVADEPSAEEALEAVETIFTAGSARARGAATSQVPDATLALRELQLKRGELSGADAKRADAFLARPVSGQLSGADKRAINGAITSQCADGVCLHYTTNVGTPADLDDSASPAEVEAARVTVQSVRTRLIAAGFKTPLPDSAAQHGGTADLDVYLMNLKQYNLYGYCAPTGTIPVGVSTTSSYCVIDNDFIGYGTDVPAQARQVTIAHEYFHAVQGAYDWREDVWMMEGSAAWIEDELYDSVNDNRMYFPGSQLRYPWVSLDYYNSSGFNAYGSWIFLRYLSERYARAGVPPLEFVKRLWDRLDASSNSEPDDYSLLGVRRLIAAAPTTFPGGFARTYNQFAAANRLPSKYYDEGAAYPKSPTVNAKFTKRTKALKTTVDIDELPHLSSYTARLVPHKSYGKKVRIKLALNLPGKAANPGVTVRTFHKNGKISTAWVPLNSRGDATKKYPFTRKKIKAIEVTVSNGSTSFNCGFNTILSCGGYPNHDYLRHKLVVRVLR